MAEIEFLFSDSRDDILKKLKKANGDTQTLHTGTAFLQMRLQGDRLKEQDKKHTELIVQQNTFNKRQLILTSLLTLGTWALVVVTMLLVKFN